MIEHGKDVSFLTHGLARGWGAMFRRELDGQVFVFAYPQPASRLFHTFFCPEPRILALNEDGNLLSDEIIPPNQFRRLPPTRIVVECSPNFPLTRADLIAISSAVSGQSFPPNKGF